MRTFNILPLTVDAASRTPSATVRGRLAALLAVNVADVRGAGGGSRGVSGCVPFLEPIRSCSSGGIAHRVAGRGIRCQAVNSGPDRQPERRCISAFLRARQRDSRVREQGGSTKSGCIVCSSMYATPPMEHQAEQIRCLALQQGQRTHLSPRDFHVRPRRLPALSWGEFVVVLHAQLLAILLQRMIRNAAR